MPERPASEAGSGEGPGSRWLTERTPAPPAELVARLAPYLDGRSPTPEGLMDAAEEALQRSLAEAPGDRRAAFHLLAADALTTYACEEAAEAAECEDLLAGLLRRAARRESSGG